MKHSYTEQDPRVRATAAIWGISIGMLGICIPLVAITNSGLVLPVLVIAGASLSTAAVWLASDSPKPGKAQKLTQTVTGLEERIKNIEAICSSVDWEFQAPTLPEAQQPVKRV